MEIIVAILALIVLVLAVILSNLSSSLGETRQKLDELEFSLRAWRDELKGTGRIEDAPASSDTATAEPAAPEEARRSVATIVGKNADTDGSVFAETKDLDINDLDTATYPKTGTGEWIRGRIEDFSLESLIGGKLPIWVGGIALAFAGFFMVRYSIEAGLIGPGARTVSATLFGLLLIALSEFGGKMPKIGVSFSEDKRIAQSLAGAGIAVLYATLYMASELYGLIGVMMAFGLVIVVTVIAFILSLRHGPPTAIMGVVGGFVAPWIAEIGPDNMPTLLAYLGIFIAALFGLSVWRRWLWLLLLATGGGAIWTFALILSAESGLPLLGLFVTLVGAGAVFATLRIEGSEPRFFQIALYAPLALAMIQLATLLPRLEFSPVGWAFMTALSAMALVLAWRDKKLLPLAGIAALISLFPLFSGWDAITWDGQSNSGGMVAASIGYALLFGGTGHVWLLRNGKDLAWALLALLAPTAAYMAAATGLHMSDNGWALLAILTALPMAWIAWLFRNEEHSKRPVSLLATALAGLFITIAAIFILPEDLIPAAFVAVAMMIAAWAHFVDARQISKLSYIPLAISILALLFSSFQVLEQMLGTLSGQIVQLDYLPSVGKTAVSALLPALMMAAMALHSRFRTGTIGTRAALIAAITGIGMFIWLLSRHVFSISDAEDFKLYGFAERMILTQPLALGGLALLWFARTKENTLLRGGALVMLGLALARFVIFDLLVFNPAIIPQALGPAPIANLGVIHCASLALTFWFAGRWMAEEEGIAVQPSRASMGTGLGIAIVAALVAVRQLSHGSIIAYDGINTGENYLYSAALILLAISWLARGIISRTPLLRVAGLSLLTIITLKVFLIDAAALEGILRILSFLGLGIALIGIGWAYGRLMRKEDTAPE